MSSRYVPPHRKRDDDEDVLEEGELSPAFQREAWQALSRTITGIVNKVSVDNVAASVTLLFRENIVRGRGLLSRSLLRTQQVDPELTMVLAALVSRINKELPDVVLLFCKRLATQWSRAYLRKDWRYLGNVAKFIADLYIFQVLDVGVIYQIIITHLTADNRGDDDVDQAAKVFEETFKAMGDRARAEFHEQVLTPFRDLLAMDGDDDVLSRRSQTVLEDCLTALQRWGKVRDEESYIPEALLLFDLAEQTTHEVDLTEKYATEDALDRYSYDKEYTAHEEQYETVRKAILGDDWEMRMLEEVATAEGEGDDGEEEKYSEGYDEEDGGTQEPKVLDGRKPSATTVRNDNTASSAGHGTGLAQQQQAAMDASKTLIDAEERELRKQVYLAMRSSVRADEAVHKILRQMKPQTERTICFMVIQGCCEERSYKKMYGMTAERLCKSNTRFQAFFVEAFRERYHGADALTVKQIEYTGKIYAHLLRTESVYWSRIIGVIDILENNESQRLLIQCLFKTLAEEMGMASLKRRLVADEETVASSARLFPADRGTESVELAVNLYAAMGLGELATGLRLVLEKRGSAEMRSELKRLRDQRC